MNNHSNLPVFQFSVRLWFEFLMLIILPHPIQCLCAIPLFMPQGHELSLVINPARKHGDISGECSIHSLDSFIANRPQTLNTNRTNIAYNHLNKTTVNISQGLFFSKNSIVSANNSQSMPPVSLPGEINSGYSPELNIAYIRLYVIIKCPVISGYVRLFSTR